MSSHRSRGHSPPRYYTDQSRATTGAVYVTPFDSGSRAGSSHHSRHSAGSVAPARVSVTYQAQPTRKSTLADGKTKTEYAIRPRNDTLNPSEPRRPLSISTRNNSPPRRSTVLVSSPREFTPTVVRDDSSRLLQPASSHNHHHGVHPRHNSTSVPDTSTHDVGVVSKDKRESSHRSRAPYVQKAHYNTRPPPRPLDDEGWSYTGPREQFDRDYPQPSTGQRDSASRKERPNNSYEIDRPAVRRDYAPHHAPTKQLQRTEKDGNDRYSARSGFDSDPDRSSDAPKKRHSTRQPVLHQQILREDGYSSARDDHDPRGHSRHKSSRYDDEGRPKQRYREPERDRDYDRDYDRKYQRDPERDRHKDYHRDYERDYDRDYPRDERTQDGRRKPRSRDNSPDRSGVKGLAASALGGLAAAGVVKGLNHKDREKEKDKDTDKDRDKDAEAVNDEQGDRRYRRRRHRSRKDEPRDESDQEERQRKDERIQQRQPESSSSDTPEDQSHHRRSSRHHRRRDENASNGELVPHENQNGRANSRVRSRDQHESSDNERSSRALIPLKQDEDPETSESRTMSAGEDEDSRSKRLQLVEPVQEKEEFKPKGILKPARSDPFPEDPNPIREGVAPLKDATKGGVPPNARWTKINRQLVNPEALEKSRERFEEREDYVIVLRVLNRDEIKKLAEKTKEIREARERDWQEKLKQQRHREREYESDSAESGSEIHHDEDDSNSRPQLAIEQGPPNPAVDFRNIQYNPSQQVPVRAPVNGLPIPDINVEANYSQNV